MLRTRTPFRRSADAGWLITVPLALIAVLLMVPTVAASGQVWSRWDVTLLFAGLILVSESMTMKFEVRRHAIGVSLTEVPVLLGLFYLSPLTLVLIRVLVTLTIQVQRKTSPVKRWFNVANIAAGTTLATTIVAILGPLPHLPGPTTWLILLAAVSAGLASTIAGVVAVIALVQGGTTIRRIIATAMPSVLVGETSAILGLIILLALHASPWSVALMAVLLLILVWVYRAYSQLLRQHRSLAEMYDLTKVIADTRHDGTLPDVLLARVRELLHAESATLWLPAQGRHPETLLSARADDAGLLDRRNTPDALRRRAMETGETVAVGPKIGDDESRRYLREHGVKDVIVVPAALRRRGDRLARGGRPARRASRTSAPRTSGCWRRSPRTPRWRWRTPGWSTGSGSTPTTTR